MNNHDSHTKCKKCKKGLMLPTAEVENGLHVLKCQNCKNKGLFLSPF